MNLKLKEAIEKYGENSVRKIFDLMIGDKIYNVYSIEGYTHKLGEMNGCPKNWWLDYSDDDYQRELVPYIDKGVHRICWGIEYDQFNSIKHKWDSFDLRSGGICKIKANGKVVYKFHYRDLGGALANAQSKIDKMTNHPFDFINPEKENGRKIWYYGLPAKIKSGYEPGEIQVEPDFSYMTEDSWWNELERRKTRILPENSSLSDLDWADDWTKENFLESKEFGIINHGSVFYDGMIWWFRD